jgi:orotidine-5'-phosphate decarboxylase
LCAPDLLVPTPYPGTVEAVVAHAPFAERFAEVRSRRGPLAWGIDPSGELLRSWGLADDAVGLERFCEIVHAAARSTVGVVKVQSAFFERRGWRGIRTMAHLIESFQADGVLVILDAKRGDVGSTNQAYAEAYLGHDAAIPVDALTVHPYLGLGAMSEFVDRAHAANAALLVVTRSSNPEGREVQSAVSPTGQSVESELLRQIGDLNEKLVPEGLGPIGAVVGPTHLTPQLDLTSARGLFLAPGVGAQGATPRDVAEVFASCPDRVIPSASRSLLEPGPDLAALIESAAHLQAEFVERLNVL